MRIFALFLFFTLTFSCSSPKSSPSTEDITVSQAKAMLEENKNLLVLDVRTPQEWAEGTIPNAIKINFYDNDFGDKINLLDSTKEVLVYCKKGGRSAKATAQLEEAGFNTIYNLTGGFDAYQIEK